MDKARDAVPRDDDHDDRHDHGVVPLAVIRPATASARLRAAREMQGLTTGDIAALTRITLRHVEALDRGDLAALPGRPYVLGFVRNYARVVGLDEADLAALDKRWRAGEKDLNALEMVYRKYSYLARWRQQLEEREIALLTGE